MPIYNNLTGIYEPDTSNYTDLSTTKSQRLQQRTYDKQSKLTPSTGVYKDLLLGMNDADSLITQRLGKTRSATNADDYYDAVELNHGNSLAKDAVDANKWKAPQYDTVAAVTGKPVDELTNQDFVDVGNMQQIQKLADLTRTQGDDRWMAPYIKGIEQTNLTGTGYKDEYGNLIDGTGEIPLNIDVGTEYQNKISYGRPLTSFSNLSTGENVTALHSNDPRMNSNYVEAADIFGAGNSQSNFLVNTARAVGSGVLQTAASVSAAPNKLYEFLGGDYLEEQSAFAKENPTYAKSVKGIISWMQKGADAIDTFDKEYVYTDRASVERLQKDIGAAFDEGEYVTGFLGALVDNPQGALEIGAQSYAYSKALIAKGISKIPGLMGATIDNMDKANELFEKEHGVTATAEQKAIMVSLATLATSIDTVAAGYIFNKSGGGKVAEGVSALIDKAIDVLPLKTVNQLLTKPVLRGIGSMTVEGVQEGPLQEGLIQLAGRQDLNAITDPEVLREIYINGMLGAVSAPGMQAVGVAEQVASSAIAVARSPEGRKALNDKMAGIKKSQEAVKDADGTTTDTPIMYATKEEKASNSKAFSTLRDTLTAKLKTGAMVSYEDVDAINKIEEVAARYDKEEDRAKALSRIAEMKKVIGENLETTDLDANPVIFGATADSTAEWQAHDYISNVLEGVGFEPSDALEKQLIKVAEKNGISKEKYEETKTAFQVEMEVTKGKGGFKTYNTLLTKHLTAPVIDKDKTIALVEKIKNFAYTQTNYADTVANRLQEVQAIVTTWNNAGIGVEPSTKYKVNIQQPVQDTSWDIHVKETDGKYKINEKSQWIIDVKRKNAEELNEILNSKANDIKQKLEIEPTDYGISRGGIQVESTSPARAADAKYYKDHKINKVITTGGKWDSGEYKSMNDGAINPSTFKKSDNVVVSIPSSMKTKELEKQLKDKYSPLSKMLNKATQAGATIVLDKSTHGKQVSLLMKQLITFKGYVNDKSQSEFVFRKEADVEESNVEEVKKTTAKNQAYADKKKTLTDAYIKFAEGKPYTNEAVEKLIADKYDGNVENFEKKLKGLLEHEVELAVELIKKIATEDAKELPARSKPIIAAHKALAKVPKVVVDAANKIVDESKIELDKYSKFIVKYKKLIDNGELEEAQAMLASVDNDAVTYILENSLSVDMTPMFIITTKDGKSGIRHSKKAADTSKKEGTPVIEQAVEIGNIVTPGVATPLNSVGVIAMGETVSSYVTDFVKVLSKALASSTPSATKLKGKSAYKSSMTTDPARAIMFSVDPKTGKEVINHNVALAVKLAVDEFVSFNNRMLGTGYKSDADIATMMGIDETKVTHQLRKLTRSKGMFKKTLANSIGKAALSKLKLKRNTEIEVEVFDKLAADLGNMAVMAMVESGDVTMDTSITTQTLNVALGRKKGTINNPISFIHFSSEEASDVNDFIDKTRETFENIHKNVQDDLVFRKMYHSKAVTNSPHEGKVAKTRVGTTTSNQVEEFMGSLRKMEWHADLKLIGRLLTDIDSLKDWLGYKDDTSAMSFYDATGQVSKNRDILKSIEELELMHKAGDEKLFFDWFYSSNGRYMMDSNTINPQTDKLHRFLVQPIEHMVTLTRKGINVILDGTDITNEFDYAIAQALGFDVDKGTSSEITKIGKAFRTKKSLLKDVTKSIKDGTGVVVAGHTLKTDHIAHAYQALDALEKFHDGKKFTTSLTAETDAVTSGFALKLMQLPILKDMFEWLNKVGVFRKGDNKRLGSMNDTLAQTGFRDSYQTLAVNVQVKESDVKDNFKKAPGWKDGTAYYASQWELLYSVLPKFTASSEDGVMAKVEPELRKLFKDPFMTFNYSAGMASIRRSLTNVLTNEVVTKLISAEDEDTKLLLNSLAKALEITPRVLQNRLSTEPLFMIQNKDGSTTLESILTTYIDAGYGSTVEAIMTSEFSEFVEAQKKVNNAFKAMFQVFNVEYTKAIDAKALKQGFITDADKLEIIDTLRDKFPAIKGPLTDKDDMTDVVAIYRTRNITPGQDGSRLLMGQTYLGGSKKASNKIAYEIKAFEEAISSGSVVPIHFIDGALMKRTADQTGSIFTAIHDAIMMPLGQINKGAHAYNKTYMETSMEYSFIEAIQDQLDNIDVTDLDTKEFKAMHNGGKVSLKDFIKESLKEFEVLSKDVKVQRAKLKKELDEGSVYMHMAALEDGVYYHNMEKAAIIPATEQQEAATQQGTNDLTTEQISSITNMLFKKNGTEFKASAKYFAEKMGYTIEDFKDC